MGGSQELISEEKCKHRAQGSTDIRIQKFLSLTLVEIGLMALTIMGMSYSCFVGWKTVQKDLDLHWHGRQAGLSCSTDLQMAFSAVGVLEWMMLC